MEEESMLFIRKSHDHERIIRIGEELIAANYIHRSEKVNERTNNLKVILLVNIMTYSF